MSNRRTRLSNKLLVGALLMLAAEIFEPIPFLGAIIQVVGLVV